MGWRGSAAAVVLLVVGIVGGYAASYALEPDPATQGEPTPVAAQSPSVPVDPLPPGDAQPSVPRLATDLPMREGRMGSQRFRLVHPVPRGWARIYNAPNEVKWKKAGNPDTPSCCVSSRCSRPTTASRRPSTDRIQDLQEEEERFRVERRTANTLEFTYASDGFLRRGFIDVAGPARHRLRRGRDRRHRP